ncbi:MAG: hypothetical protein ABI024_05355 [Vicinamibacterales bacterium]
MSHPHAMVVSDGVPLNNGGGHPRGVGTYARVLGHYVREQKVIDLMTALRKITVMVAERLEPYLPAMRRKDASQSGWMRTSPCSIRSV